MATPVRPLSFTKPHITLKDLANAPMTIKPKPRPVPAPVTSPTRASASVKKVGRFTITEEGGSPPPAPRKSKGTRKSPQPSPLPTSPAGLLSPQGDSPAVFRPYKMQKRVETKPKTPKRKLFSDGGAYTIHTGPRGGKYVLVDGKKRYVS